MPLALSAVLSTVKSGMPLQLRASACKDDYLEGVLTRDQLPQCEAVLRAQFGEPAKPFDAKAALKLELRKPVDKIGGVWPDQCLFLAPAEGGGVVYAALWPWKSDTTKITLRLGLIPPG
jgi:hypothetical protein